MLVLEQTEDHEGASGNHLRSILGYILQEHRHASPGLRKGISTTYETLHKTYFNSTRFLCSSLYRTLRTLEVLKLEYACVIAG